MENLNPKDVFRDALLELSEVNKINNITVVDLVEKAGLSRQTFYRHFYNIDDLVFYIHKKNVESAHISMDQLNDGAMFIDLYVKLMHSNKRFYKQVISFNPQSPFVQTYISETKKKMLVYTFNKNTQELLESRKLYFDYSFYCIAFCISLLEWLKYDNDIPPQEVANSFKALIPNSLVRFLYF
ncbi:TetR/AcrR family transcriptional regulator [Lagierella sp.]|uniref:TetR/AcrR family transcriptional regulator n=1 Tax=Lagierella sp. TaxID=2849657 RepID=UPI00260189FA|nr:TetR/AcrR family transcriptional regulator [Lagierella sp.]